MQTDDEKQWELIEKIFNRFLLQTQATTPQLSRDYFERFTQLLNQTFRKHPLLKPSIVSTITSLISPYHRSNLVTFEYQLRLIRYSLRQHLQISDWKTKDFLDQLFHHSLLVYSSILRHLALQIAILLYEQDLHQIFDEKFFAHIIQLFSPDPNLYVRHSLVQFLALYLSKHDQHRLLEQIQHHSDLIYEILVLLDQNQQELFIKQLNIYDHLSDTPATRVFLLKTAKFLSTEDRIVFYLNRILDKSLSDYVHLLCTIISSRAEHHRSTLQLQACLKALFLYLQETEFEEIELHEPSIHVNQFEELTESICCRLYDRNIQSTDLASIVLEIIQPWLGNEQSFLDQLDFYPSIIIQLLSRENQSDKDFARLINCFAKLVDFHTPNLFELIIKHVKGKERSTAVYHALFHLIRNAPDALESIEPIIDQLLFDDVEELFQWDKKDGVLHLLIQLTSSTRKEFPSWLTNEFLRRIIQTLVLNTNEYIQGSLIELLGTLVEHDLLSPVDEYLTSNFIQLTQSSLGDVVRCALAHVWFIILTKSNTMQSNYPFSFGKNTDRHSLVVHIIAQVPRLIGDGGHETEIRCLRLIESLEMNNNELSTVLDFLLTDGSSNEIKDAAARLLSLPSTQQTNEILEDELHSILHWLEHPDEHLILDCD